MAWEDPELFATYLQLAADSRKVVRAHVDDLTGQLARIIADGVARGQLAVADPGIDAAFEGVRSLVLRGLGARAADEGS